MKTRILILLVVLSAILESVNIDSQLEDKSLKKVLTKYFVRIPSGKAIVNGDSVSVQAFYVYNKEVTNINYKEFLSDLKGKGDLESLKIATIDSLGWNKLNFSNQAYVQYYHSHPAYNDYPVVNISHEAAQLYCKWLGEKYDQMTGMTGKFKFRLMEKAEYVRAARGDSEASYAWKNYSLRNSEGQMMCNFTQLGSEDIHFNDEKGLYEICIAPRDFSNGYGDIMAPSKSYWPNEFGVYNLNGNVAEMIAEKGIAMGGSWRNTGYDVRVESQNSYTQGNPMTGFRMVITSIETE